MQNLREKKTFVKELQKIRLFINFLKNNRVFIFIATDLYKYKLSRTFSLHLSRSHIYIFLCSILILFLFYFYSLWQTSN